MCPQGQDTTQKKHLDWRKALVFPAPVQRPGPVLPPPPPPEISFVHNMRMKGAPVLCVYIHSEWSRMSAGTPGVTWKRHSHGWGNVPVFQVFDHTQSVCCSSDSEQTDEVTWVENVCQNADDTCRRWSGYWRPRYGRDLHMLWNTSACPMHTADSQR